MNAESRHDEELGRLGPGLRDSSPKPEMPNQEPMELPEGALVALCKSGGLRFSTRTLIIYGNGEGLYTSNRGKGLESIPLDLTETQQLRLRRTISRIDFAALPKGPGRTSPDAYVYEIAVRTLGQTFSIEAWDGSVPPALKPLLVELQRLMPQ